jgi:MFS family permease
MMQPTPTTPTDSRPALPRAVLWLGLVSLATDAASEMIYPLMPLFLTTILGAGAGFVGVIEGAAEATASLLKLWSGRIADRARRKKPLTLFGYGISSILRPLAGLAVAPWMILAVRVGDRVGKGLRSSPRDALLAEVTPPEQRGRAFGFHRSMDNAGAVIGPALATLLLLGHFSLRAVFLFAVIPGALAMLALAAGVREPDAPAVPAQTTTTSSAPPARGYTAYLIAVGLFALGNSTDAFLLLRAGALGVEAHLIPVLWMLHNLVRASLTTVGGALSDRVGRRKLIIGGWTLYAACYLGFGLANRAWQVWLLMAAYGLYYSLVEGTEKALVVDLAGAGRRGWAFGRYYAVIGLCALPASFVFGAAVESYGARVPFTVSAGLAMVAALVLALWVPEPRR